MKEYIKNNTLEESISKIKIYSSVSQIPLNLQNNIVIIENDGVYKSLNGINIKIYDASNTSGSSGIIGSIISYWGNTIPNGYLECDGSVYDTTRYSELYSVLGSNTLPDFRECAMRGGTQSVTNYNQIGRFIDDKVIPHCHCTLAKPSNVCGHYHLYSPSSCCHNHTLNNTNINCHICKISFIGGCQCSSGSRSVTTANYRLCNTSDYNCYKGPTQPSILTVNCLCPTWSVGSVGSYICIGQTYCYGTDEYCRGGENYCNSAYMMNTTTTRPPSIGVKFLIFAGA